MTDAAKHSHVFDSGRQQLSGIYARALIGAAEQAGNSETILSELNEVVAVFEKLPRFNASLCSPRVPLASKEQLINQVFQGKINQQLLNFLKVLARRGRFECLALIASLAQQLLDQLRGRLEVFVRSAVPLEGNELAQVTDRLKQVLKSDVKVRASVDPDLIGGLVVRVGDTVYDGSVANRLVRLREDALRNATQQMRQSIKRYVVAD